jgi:hypothetical protein
MKMKVAKEGYYIPKTLKYWDTINLYYGKQETLKLQG